MKGGEHARTLLPDRVGQGSAKYEMSGLLIHLGETIVARFAWECMQRTLAA
jgi:hypothetical protein